MSDEVRSEGGMTPVKAVIVALPLCLVISVIGAIWFHWHSETQEEADPALALANEGMNRGEVEDLVEKFGWLNTEGWDTAAGRKGIRQRIALIGGTLSPQNYGYLVRRGTARSHEGELWPTLWVDVEGKDRRNEVVVVAVPYDGGSGDVVALLTAAKDIRDVAPARTIRLLFYPWSLQHSGEGPLEFLGGGEDVVAILALQQMEEAGDGSAARLQVGGPALGALEPALRDPGVERVEQDPVTGVAAVFGPPGAAVYQTVIPVGVEPAMSKRDYPGQDLDALMERVRVLLRVLESLAAAGSG